MSAEALRSSTSGGMQYIAMPPAPTGPKPIKNPAGLTYLQAPVVPEALPPAPKQLQAAVPGAVLLTKKELYTLRTNIWSLRLATPLAVVVVTFLACSLITDSNEPMLEVGAVWAAVCWPFISWSIWKHRALGERLERSAIVVEGGHVTSAKSVSWRRRSTEAVVGYMTFRVTRLVAYLALRHTHGTVGSHISLALGIGIVAGLGAWAVTKQVLQSRAVTA